MRKVILYTVWLLILLFYVKNNFAQNQQTPNSSQPKYPKGRYEDRADSIRKENLAPRRSDSVLKSSNDKMPVISNDTNKNPHMPNMQPENNQHMPVKELSDTTRRK
jgi:hypothetical protein